MDAIALNKKIFVTAVQKTTFQWEQGVAAYRWHIVTK